MDDIEKELKKLKGRVYIEEMNHSLDFAKEFLAKIAENPKQLDSIPEGALLVPYPVPVSKKSAKAKA